MGSYIPISTPVFIPREGQELPVWFALTTFADSSPDYDDLIVVIRFKNVPEENIGVWIRIDEISKFTSAKPSNLITDSTFNHNRQTADSNCELCTNPPNSTISVFRIDPNDSTSGIIIAHKSCLKKLQAELHSYDRLVHTSEELMAALI